MIFGLEAGYFIQLIYTIIFASLDPKPPQFKVRQGGLQTSPP